MPTLSVNLDTTQYVKVNSDRGSLILQAFNDSVRVTLSDNKPIKSNNVFHLLGGKDAPLHLNSLGSDLWVLPVTDRSSLIVSTLEPVITHTVISKLFSEGRIFEGSEIFVALSDNDFIELLIETGSKDTLISVSINVLGDFQVWEFEDTVVSNKGSLLTSININRPKSVANPSPLSDVYLTPTVTADGTLLGTGLLLGGEKKDAVSSDAQNLLVKKATTNYLFRFQNLSGQASQGTISWTLGE